MKYLQICLAGLAVFLAMVSCAVGQPSVGLQTLPTAPDLPTFIDELTNTPGPSITPIPPPTRRATSPGAFVLEPTVIIPITRAPVIASLTAGPTITYDPTFLRPTFTPFVRPPRPVSWTATPEPFACQAIALYPPWGKVFTPREDFVAKWRLVNTGENMWHVDDIFFGYVSGEKMHNRDRGETILPITVYKGERIPVQVHMKAPKEPGYYMATWGLRKTNKEEFFCTFWVTVTVQKK